MIKLVPETRFNSAVFAGPLGMMRILPSNRLFSELKSGLIFCSKFEALTALTARYRRRSSSLHSERFKNELI
jgi:hypothetical protein